VTVDSEAPISGTTPTQVIIYNATADVATGNWPGQAQYTIPGSGESSVSWRTDTNAATTWLVSCA
jgi:hypothetical protein